METKPVYNSIMNALKFGIGVGILFTLIGIYLSIGNVHEQVKVNTKDIVEIKRGDSIRRVYVAFMLSADTVRLNLLRENNRLLKENQQLLYKLNNKLK